MTTTTITQTSVSFRITKAPEAIILPNANDVVMPTNYVPRGFAVPPNVPHAITSSMPTWNDAYAYVKRDPNLVMMNAYPRFFIHRSIKKVRIVVECQIYY